MISDDKHKSIILIGMPGAGKSTLGVLLAKNLAKTFVDTDIVLQTQIGSSLQEFLNRFGYMSLREKEQEMLLNSSFKSQVVATGGSVVYSDEGMAHLKQFGTCIYLKLSMESLRLRVGNIDNRGVAAPKSMSFGALFDERKALYEKYADISCEIEGMSIEESVKLVENSLL